MYLEEGQIHLVPASANTGGGDIRDVGLYGPIVRDIGMGPCRPWEHRNWGAMGVRERLTEMQMFLQIYISSQSGSQGKWKAASMHAATLQGKGTYQARVLRKRVCAFISDREDLPLNPYGVWNESVLDRDESLAQEIHLHLQSIGKSVKAEDLIDFMDTPNMRKRSGQTKQMAVQTAQ